MFCFYKLISKRNIHIVENEIQEFLGSPEIFPLKVNFLKNQFYSKVDNWSSFDSSKLNTLNKKNTGTGYTTIFANKKDFYFVKNILKKVCISFEKHLSGDIQETISQNIKSFKLNYSKKQNSK